MVFFFAPAIFTKIRNLSDPEPVAAAASGTGDDGSSEKEGAPGQPGAACRVGTGMPDQHSLASCYLIASLQTMFAGRLPMERIPARYTYASAVMRCARRGALACMADAG